MNRVGLDVIVLLTPNLEKTYSFNVYMRRTGVLISFLIYCLAWPRLGSSQSRSLNLHYNKILISHVRHQQKLDNSFELMTSFAIVGLHLTKHVND